MALRAVPKNEDELLEYDEPDATAADAASRIEEATGATSGEAAETAPGEGVQTTVEPESEAARKPRAKRPKLPALPPNLDAPVLTFPGRLKLVSFGKTIKNVTATLVFDVLVPIDPREILGERAYTVGFLGGMVADGAHGADVPTKTDAENRIVQTLKLRVPRYVDGQTDQFLSHVAPLIGGHRLVQNLFETDWPWRLNVPVDIEGEVSLYDVQTSLNLLTTTRAE